VLDSYELAVVTVPNRRPDAAHQPIVKITHDAMGIPLSPPITADLSLIDEATGRPYRSIIKTTEPERYGINVADCFI
jgi:hypothetical protein